MTRTNSSASGIPLPNADIRLWLLLFHMIFFQAKLISQFEDEAVGILTDQLCEQPKPITKLYV